MPRLEDLPLEFRVLYRQFLLRVIDLEALSVHADIPRFLGQFASILVFISVVGSLGLLFSMDSLAGSAHLPFLWRVEQSLISGTMLLVGLVAVVSWDSTFPDRQDVMVLSPLPVAPRTILFAKLAASASLLGLAVLTLNFALGIFLPLWMGAHHHSIWKFLQAIGAYWLTLWAATLFLYGSMLTIQGLTSLLLSRRMFLVVSAFLQITAFCLFLGVYFFQPTFTFAAAMAQAGHHWLAYSPAVWFFAVFHQLNGSLPRELRWVAIRGWASLGLVSSGGLASLVLCYLQTIRKTLEEPDLVPGMHGLHWVPHWGIPVQTAVVLFGFRSIVRSRQHRLALAVFAAVIFSVALSWLHVELSAHSPLPVTAPFLASTFVIMSLAVLGLRAIFSLPISLNANWVLRTTQLSRTEKYVSATRWTLLLLAAAPAWLITALLCLRLRPLHHIVVHLLILILVGWLLVEISLINFYKVPFTCSYLPGKVHIQVLLWCSLVLLAAFGITCSEVELPALSDSRRIFFMIVALVTCCVALSLFNQRRAKSAELYFEEPSPDIITSLDIGPLCPETQATALLNPRGGITAVCTKHSISDSGALHP